MCAQLNVVLPQQRLPYSKKAENDFDWGKKCLDAIARNLYSMNGQEDNKYKSDIQRKLANYRLYNNQVDQEEFEKECNPFGLTSKEFQDKIQPYNKTYNKINVLLGEELKRPFNHRVYLLNSDAVESYNREKTKLLQDYFSQFIASEKEKFIAEFQLEQQELTEEEYNQKMQEIEAQFNEFLPPDQVEKYLQTNWREAREILADKLLQYFVRKLKIRNLKNTGFKHSLISGEEFAWVGVVNGEPVVEILNPLKVFFHKSSETEFIQDGYYAGYRTRMTIADVLDRYAEELTEEDKKNLDNITTTNNLFGITTDFLKNTIELEGLNKSLEYRMLKDSSGVEYLGSYGSGTYNDVDVIHVEWRSQRKVGFLTFYDESGKSQMDFVDEKFEIPTGYTTVKYRNKYGKMKTKYTWIVNEQPFELEWGWIPEVWEGVRINSNVYVGLRPKPYQFRDPDNPFKVKLGYHGLVYNAMNAPSISPMDRMKPFQYLYFIIMHKMKEIIAKDMPPLTMIDFTMIPKTLTNEQWMYYYKQGLGFYNPHQNDEGNPTQMSGQKGPAFEVQRSVMNHVNNYIEILSWIDNQINEVSGVTKQREGQTSANEAVTNSQQNITQSSHITEILFNSHNILWEDILTSLIETAQFAYKDEPKKIPLILDDMSRQVLEIDTDSFPLAKLGVFIADNPNDYENLSFLRQQSLSFIQNGSRVSDVAKILRATSMEAVEREFKALEAQRDSMLQAQEQANLDMQKQLKEMEIEAREDEQAHELEVIDRKGYWDIQKAQLTSLGMDEGSNEGTILEQTKLAIQEAKTLSDIQQKDRQIANDERSQQFEEIKLQKQLEDKEKDRKSKEKIARSKPKPTKK